MDDRPLPPGALLLTGASGTFGTALLHTLRWPGEVAALGRTRPRHGTGGGGGRPVRFLPVDLADAEAVAQLGQRLAAGPPVGALVCAAGLDARARLVEFNAHAAAACMQVNTWAHVHLLHAAVISRAPGAARTALPVVLVSSDVVGAATPGTLVYAATKAAAEEAFRHATADAAPPGIALLIVRLPDIGVHMRAAAPGPPPPPRAGGAPLPVLAAAVEAISSFLTTRQQTVEVWHA